MLEASELLVEEHLHHGRQQTFDDLGEFVIRQDGGFCYKDEQFSVINSVKGFQNAECDYKCPLWYCWIWESCDGYVVSEFILLWKGGLIKSGVLVWFPVTWRLTTKEK